MIVYANANCEDADKPAANLILCVISLSSCTQRFRQLKQDPDQTR